MSIVRIDPGHGGFDVGAIGHGLQESDIVLEVSQLATAMVRMAGADVQLIRVRDVPLEQQYRSRALTQPGAACVVSVHCNGWDTPEPRGHEVFVSAFSDPSRRLGECISHELIGRLPIPPRSPAVKTRLTEDGRDYYYAIRDPVSVGIPAVLVELGFVSNPRDAAFLERFWGRFSAAYAIARGVLAWLGHDPDAPATLNAIRSLVCKGGE